MQTLVVKQEELTILQASLSSGLKPPAVGISSEISNSGRSSSSSSSSSSGGGGSSDTPPLMDTTNNTNNSKNMNKTLPLENLATTNISIKLNSSSNINDPYEFKGTNVNTTSDDAENKSNNSRPKKRGRKSMPNKLVESSSSNESSTSTSTTTNAIENRVAKRK